MPQQGNSWVVEGGDNVFSIAQKVFGNQRMAMEILRMNGGQTLIRPGDVLSLPDWNDPNLYIGANEFQGVLNQNAQNKNYKGPTVAAVPDSQRAALESSLGISPSGAAPIIPSVQQRFREADAAQGATAVQAPNMPKNPYSTQRSFRQADAASMGIPTFKPLGGNTTPNARRGGASSPTPAAGIFSPYGGENVDLSGRNARSGIYNPLQPVTGNFTIPQNKPTVPNLFGTTFPDIQQYIQPGSPTTPVTNRNQQGRRDKGVAVQQTTIPNILPKPTVPGEQKSTRFQSLLMEDKMRPELTAPEQVIPARVHKGLTITMAQTGYDQNRIAWLTASAEEGGGGYVYDKMTGIFYPAGKVPTNVSLDYAMLPEYDWNQSHEPNYGNYGYGGGGEGGGYTGGGGGGGVNSSSVAAYSLSTRLATG